VPQTLMLDWQPRRLRINWRTQHAVEARVANAPDGSWYLAWKAEDGWSIGRTTDLMEPIQVRPQHWQLPERTDVELIGLAWAVGLNERQVKRHLAYDLSEDEAGTAGFSWECRACHMGGVNNPTPDIAAAKARGHWRRELLAAVEERKSNSGL